MSPARIVIVGGGFAGASCARQLERRLGHDQGEITLINAQNNFVFTPILVEAATSALEPRHVVVPLRRFLKRSRFIMAEVKSVDFENQTVTAQPEFGDEIAVPYDHLVLAPGSVTRLPDVDGLQEFGFELKTISDALALRDRAIGMLEMANGCPTHEQRQSWLTFVVVGGGYTGVETAGEFNAFLREATEQYPNVNAGDVRVVLVQLDDRILETLDEIMSEKATRILRKHGVDIRLNESVTGIRPSSCSLKSGEMIDSHTVIWSAGVAPPPLMNGFPLPKNKHGYLRCDPDLRVTGQENVWGIGDCASNPDPTGNPYPPTAQHAVREGRHAANNLVAMLSGRSTAPFDYHSKGTMAPLGGRQAIANVFGVHLTGWLAWFMWRSVYLMLMPTWGRKVRVAMDWTADLFFRRDCSQQGLHVGRQARRPGGVANAEPDKGTELVVQQSK